MLVCGGVIRCFACLFYLSLYTPCNLLHVSFPTTSKNNIRKQQQQHQGVPSLPALFLLYVTMLRGQSIIVYCTLWRGLHCDDYDADAEKNDINVADDAPLLDATGRQLVSTQDGDVPMLPMLRV
jgi:hypothetical protein